MNVRALGELPLISRLASCLADDGPGDPAVLLGIGDDAAVWRPAGGAACVISTDTMVQGTHFTATTLPPRDLGWKGLAVNISDLAAMGAKPRAALMTIGLTGDEPVGQIEELCFGVREAARAYAVQIIGGDTVRAPQLQLAFTVIGEAAIDAEGEGTLRRAAAQAGDILAVTGVSGDSAAGLDLLLRDAADSSSPLVTAHRRPRPRVREAQWLYASGVRCATDSSDSLLTEVQILCAESGVGAVVDAASLPLSAALLTAYPDRAVELALNGGEDYELVIAVPAAHSAELLGAWRRTFALPLTVIGRFTPAPASGAAVRVEHYAGPFTTFEHFPAPPR